MNRLLDFSHARPVLACALSWLLVAPALALGADGESTPLGLEPSARAAPEAVGGGSGLVRTIVGLAVVIALILGITWVLKWIKASREAQSSGTALKALATLPLGPNRALHLVRAGELIVLLAVGEGGTTTVRTYHEDEARSLGLIPAQGNDGGLGALTAPVGVGLADGHGSADGRIQRLLEEIRRRTVIR